MKITNFQHTGLDKIECWIKRNQIKEIDEHTLREALATVNIFFIAEGITRIQSMLLCELKASYIQQSQRYVTMDGEVFTLPQLEDKDNRVGNELVKRSLELYAKMSELRQWDIKGRPQLENYVHGIPIEDARYVLPLCAKTNMCVTMSGDKLYQLYCLINSNSYDTIFSDFKHELNRWIPAKLIGLLPGKWDNHKNKKLIRDLYLDDLQKINPDNNLVLLNAFKNLELQAGLGALTSTQSSTSAEILTKWGNEATDKARDVVDRVLGYGHESIAEQARTTFGMMLSLTAYHQQVRHRLPESYREELLELILDRDRPVLIPRSISQAGFYEDFLGLTKEIKEYRLYIYEKYGEEKALPFLLNCDQLKMIISTNARIDVKMLSERTCMNAQWEIRELAIKKLKSLRGMSHILYEKALPACVISKCKEGKLSCGKHQEVKKLFTRR
ncbi:MAG: FAD-dependent thymidylate synthase [Clostridia bacterium]|nr:FAD-dependent thymidylate synthase [Clostridia bacterium]